jgi:CheY-like chemotaxis protein
MRTVVSLPIRVSYPIFVSRCTTVIPHRGILAQEGHLKEAMKGGFQIQRVIDASIRQLGDLTGPKPVAIVAAYPAHFPLLAGDESKFQQALIGLLSDMISNTEREEVRIRVQMIPAGTLKIPNELKHAELGNMPGPWALISISDIDGSDRAATGGRHEVFKEESIKSWLPYEECERFISQMGGLLWREGHEPSGTTVRVAIPLISMIADLTRVRIAVETHLPQQECEGKTIQLLVEDEAIREQIIHEFTFAGYRVLVCQEASEVLSLARDNDPDLLILDLQIREFNAFDLARLIKQDPALARIPLLFLTAIPDPAGGFQMDTAGFLVRAEGTGAMLATVHMALSSGVAPSARVLVVEPNEALREQMILRIQAQGHPVVEAASAEEALALAERTSIGVVLANAQLAQARDYWLIRQLVSLSSTIKIYVVSETLSDEDGRAAILRGASGFGDTGRLSDLLKHFGREEDAENVDSE